MRANPSMAPPASNPQNAPLTPRNPCPDAVTRNVTNAASRPSTTETAPHKADPNAPSSANPATAWINTGGDAAMNAVAAPASSPNTTYVSPATTAAH